MNNGKKEDGTKSPRSQSPTVMRVRFDLHAPEAHKGSLAGEFNGWNVDSLSMKMDKKGTWKVSVSLSPGRYEYRFLADGTWRDHPGAQEKVTNPFCTQNCVKIVV